MATKTTQRTRAAVAAKRPPAEPDEILSTAQLSTYLGVPVGTLRNWRMRRYGPRGFKAGNAVKYRRSVVDAWVAAQEAAEMDGTDAA